MIKANPAINNSHPPSSEEEINNHFRNLANNSADIIWALNQERKPVYISPSAEALLGYSIAEIFAKPDILFSHSIEFKSAIDSFSAMITIRDKSEHRELAFQFISRFDCKNKSSIWGETVLSPLFDNNNIRVGLMGITRNITDRKRTELELQQLLSELANIGSYGKKFSYTLEIDDETQITLEQLTQYIGADFGEILLRDGENFVIRKSTYQRSSSFWKDTPYKDSICGLAVSKNQTICSDNVLNDPVFHFSHGVSGIFKSIIAVPMFDETGGIFGLLRLGSKDGASICKHIDLVEKVSYGFGISIQTGILLKLLKQQNEFLKYVMSSLMHPFYVLNVDDYSVVVANKFAGEFNALQDVTCYALTHNLTSPCSGLDHPCPIREILETRRPVIVEHLHTDLNGEPRYMQVHGHPIFNENGDIKQIIEYSIDITEQVYAEKMLLRSEKLVAVGKLAASVAHEIKNPLQSVLGCLGLAQEAVSEGRKADKYFQVARDSLIQVSEIVNRMQELYRPSKEHREQCNINLLLHKVLDLTKKQFSDQGVRINWSEDTTLAPIWMFPDQIHQVFLNLILNALDAMPNGGKMEIQTISTQEPNGIKIVFSDTGEGISKENLPNIFEPFFTTKEKGSGLGLPVSFGLVEDHNGWIDVESDLGAGSRFSVWLPHSLRYR